MFLSARVKIYRPGVALDLHAEILSFPGGIHDDMVDALGLTAQQLIELLRRQQSTRHLIFCESSNNQWLTQLYLSAVNLPN